MTERTITRILVPVDFSPASINALDAAILIAQQHEAAIILLNVVETGGLSGESGYHTGEAALALAHHSKQELLSLQYSIAEKFLLPCDVISANGPVSATIIKISASHHADIIVMGTHGTSGSKNTLIGLNAFNVVKNAECPVLTVPPEKSLQSFRKVLFPLRAIPSALEKYEVVRRMVSLRDIKLKVLGLAASYEKDIDVLKALVCRLNERLKDDAVEVCTYFKVGRNMAEEVLKIAGLMEADLIVITNTVDRLSGQFFVDPYTRYIINHSVVPVLTVKPLKTFVHAGEDRHASHEQLPHNMPLY